MEGDEADDAGLVLLQHRTVLVRELGAKGMAELRMSRLGAPRSRQGRGDGYWGLNMSAMNTSVVPGDDFYSYISGTWLATTEIPSDETSWSAFSMLGKQVEEQVHGILSSAPPESLVGTMYTSFMDEATVDALGALPLGPELEKIKGIQDAAGFAEYAGSTNFGFGSSLFAMYTGADEKSTDETWVMHLTQSGLGLPSRDYYLEEHFADLKKAYGEHIGKALELAGWPDAAAAGAAVLAFESKIANVSWPRTRLRDSQLTYHKMTPDDLLRLAPGFEWGAFMRGAGGIPGDATLIVSAYSEGGGDGIPGMARVVGETDLGDLRSYAAWHVVKGASSYLAKPFYDLKFDFFGRRLAGQQEPSARWKRAVSIGNSFVGDAVGKEFVAKYFPESAKRQMDKLTGLLRRAFAARIRKVSWMTEGTKAKALEKLDSFTFQVGGPRKYKDYEGLTLSAGDLFGNVGRAIEWDWRFELQRLGKKIDRDYWDMVPQEVNAFFDQTKNTCVFLAGIMQPPFFSAEADMSVNFGAIGGVIGHEMTHGFDDQGRQYDAKGRLNDWWTEKDAEEFKRRAKAYGEQFAKFTRGLPPGSRIKPELTMGENIADLGGLTLAYDAYRLWREDHDYTPEAPYLMPAADGLEGDRRVFAGWDQVWRTKYTPKALEVRLLTDPHSPGPARGIIPVQNLDPWYTAYEVVEGQAMYLDKSERVVIW